MCQQERSSCHQLSAESWCDGANENRARGGEFCIVSAEFELQTSSQGPPLPDWALRGCASSSNTI